MRLVRDLAAGVDRRRRRCVVADRRPAAATTGVEGGARLVGAGLSVWLLNVLFRIGVSGDRERDDEDAARDFFDAHGYWPDEEPPAGPAPIVRCPAPVVPRTADGSRRRARARARETGRLGIDTEFMGEGRYRPLLCLVQVAVPRAAGRRLRVEVLDPLDGRASTPRRWPSVLADPAIEIVLHAGRQDVALLRRVWATRGHATSSTRRSPPASPGCAPSSATSRCCTRCSACGCASPRASRAGTRRPLSAGAGRLRRARTSCTCSRSPTRCRSACASSGAWSGRARSAASSRTISDERDPDAIFAPAAAHQLRSTPARARSPASSSSGARRRRASRTARSPSVLQDAALIEIAKRRPRSLERAGADPRPQRGHAAPARQGDRRGRRARPRARRHPRPTASARPHARARATRR